jgi:hypothetical protein
VASYRSEVLVDASPEQVWEVLVDLPRYGEWNPFTIAVRSKLEVGASVDMDVRLNGRVRRQRETVRVVQPHRCLDWGMQLGPRWLLRAERRQHLTAEREARTRYVTEDRIEGWLAPLVHLLYGRTLTAGFAAMATALKERVEHRGPRRAPRQQARRVSSRSR